MKYDTINAFRLLFTHDIQRNSYLTFHKYCGKMHFLCTIEMTSQQKHRAAAMRAVATVTVATCLFVFGFIAFNVLFVDEKR